MNATERRILDTILTRIADRGLRGEAQFGNLEGLRWRSDVVTALIEAGIISATRSADSIICRACEERCLRPVYVETTAQAEPQAYSTCELLPGMGPFSRSPDTLLRWTGSRRGVAEFFGRTLELGIKSNDEQWRSVRYRSYRVGKLRCAVALEFRETALVHVGSLVLPLLDLLDWDDGRISVDRDALTAAAGRSPERSAAGSNYQPSTAIREGRKAANRLRDRRVQRSLDELARAHPNLSKEQLVKKLAKSDRNEGMSVGNILRVTRMPAKKLRRKNFA